MCRVRKFVLPILAIVFSWTLGPASAMVVGLFVAMNYHYQAAKRAVKPRADSATPTLNAMAAEAEIRDEPFRTIEQQALDELRDMEQGGISSPATHTEPVTMPEQSWHSALSPTPQQEQTHGMSNEQRIAVAIGLAVAILLAIVPPWHFTFRGIDESCGYSFIAVAVTLTGDRGCSIDVGRLLIEWGAVAGATALYAIIRGRSKPQR